MHFLSTGDSFYINHLLCLGREKLFSYQTSVFIGREARQANHHVQINNSYGPWRMAQA
jgi:hypothetical protein